MYTFCGRMKEFKVVYINSGADILTERKMKNERKK